MKAVAALFQLGAQFQVVVDFAVEDDDGVAVVASESAGRPIPRSMIFSRVAPSEQVADSNAPCWSGPRWTSVAVASAIRSGRGESVLMCETDYPAHDFVSLGPRKSSVTKLSHGQATICAEKGRKALRLPAQRCNVSTHILCVGRQSKCIQQLFCAASTRETKRIDVSIIGADVYHSIGYHRHSQPHRMRLPQQRASAGVQGIQNGVVRKIDHPISDCLRTDAIAERHVLPKTHGVQGGREMPSW